MGLKKEEKARLKEFEKNLRYRFKLREHLKRALTHKSFTNEQHLPPAEHNERYEYLGDAVLELSVSALLMERFPAHSEGDLSKLRAAVVNEEELARTARKLHLGSYLYLGKGEDLSGGREKASLLANAFEAVLGAIYLDRGFSKAMDVVEHHYDGTLAEVGGVGFVRDYKTRLQEVVQSRFRATPRYRLVREIGPDHQKSFEVALSIKEEVVSVGRGQSKKAAEQAAAQAALKILDEKE